jgi:hypothetical protein
MARKEKTRTAQASKPLGKRPLVRPRWKWKDKFKCMICKVLRMGGGWD